MCRTKDVEHMIIQLLQPIPRYSMLYQILSLHHCCSPYAALQRRPPHSQAQFICDLSYACYYWSPGNMHVWCCLEGQASGVVDHA